jgi:cell division protein FtsL
MDFRAFLLVFLLFVAILVIEVFFRFLNRRDTKELLNRIMAKDYKEYEYFEKKYEKDVKEEENIREEARKEREDFRKSEAIEEELKRAEGGKEISLLDFEEEISEEE